MISFGFQGRSRDSVIQLAEKAAELLKGQKTVQLLGPAPAMIEKSHMGYHWKLVLKSSKAEDTTGGLLRQAASFVLNGTQDKYVRVTIDVDPYQIL